MAAADASMGMRPECPEQISARLRIDFPEVEAIRISHEPIYQPLYVQGRGIWGGQPVPVF